MAEELVEVVGPGGTRHRVTKARAKELLARDGYAELEEQELQQAQQPVPPPKKTTTAAAKKTTARKEAK